MPLSGTITFANCKSLGDVEYAINEATRCILDGKVVGGDSNSTGDYEFEVNGENDTLLEPGDTVRLISEIVGKNDDDEDTPILEGDKGTVESFDRDEDDGGYTYATYFDDVLVTLREADRDTVWRVSN